MNKVIRFLAALSACTLVLSAPACRIPASAEVAEAALPDGEYTPTVFSYSGGTGRLTITCDSVTVASGVVTAHVCFSSKHIEYVRVGTEKYYPVTNEHGTAFELPILPNANTELAALTTAMSTPHEVAYTLYVGLGTVSSEGPEVLSRYGISVTEEQPNESAALFTVFLCDGALTALQIDEVGLYLLVPEGASAPAGMENEPEVAGVIRLPAARAYVAEELLPLLPDSAPVTAGSASAIDYAALLTDSCELAILPALTEAAALSTVAERLDTLGIPLLLDRSSSEATEAARAEWSRVYALLFS